MKEAPPRQKLNAAKLKWLKGELPDLVSEGLVTPESAPIIVDKYEKQLAGGGRAWLVYVLGIFAAVLLGTGVIMFFASNWEYIGKYQKLFIICVALAGSYFGAYQLKYKREYPIIGEAMMLLGAVLFGAGIYLVAQAFNIKAHFPNGVLLWMLGLIPLMMLEKSKPLLAQAVVLYCIWVIWELVALDGWWTPDEAWAALSIRIYLAIVPLAFLGWAIYKFGVKANAVLLPPAVAIWIGVYLIQAGRDLHSENPAVFPLIPFAFAAAFGVLSVMHSRNDKLPNFGGVYRFYSMLIVGFILYLMTFPKLMREMEADSLLPHALLVAGLLAAAAIWAFFKSFERDDDPHGAQQALEAWTYIGVLAFGAATTLLLMSDGAGGFIGFVSNFALVGFIASLIVAGTRTGRPGMVNFGVFLFAALVITRYFDWFWDLFDRSLFFILGGLVFLLGGVFLEKRRRALVMKAKEASL